jgi:hypothetical protein
MPWPSSSTIKALQSAAFDANAHRTRTGVEGVLDKLFGRSSRPLHHLARGDAVHSIGRQAADAPRRAGEG